MTLPSARGPKKRSGNSTRISRTGSRSAPRSWKPTIAELESNQQELRHSEEIFRLLVEGVREYAIFMLGPDGRIVSWNEGAERVQGYEVSEAGEHFSVFYTEEDVDRGLPGEELRVAAIEGRFEEEGWRVRKDGTLFQADVVITAEGRGG